LQAFALLNPCGHSSFLLGTAISVFIGSPSSPFLFLLPALHQSVSMSAYSYLFKYIIIGKSSAAQLLIAAGG
jgi:hypothetical protein